VSDVFTGALWARDLRHATRPELDGRYAITEVGRAEAMAGHLARAMGTSEAAILERVAGGGAWVAWSWRDEEVVAWCWVSTRETYATPLRRTLQLGAGDCFAWGAETLEAHRGRGLFTAILEHIAWHLAREGWDTLWGGIGDDKIASQRANARAGFRPVLRVTAEHEPPPTQIWSVPADYADARLVERAREMLGPSASLLAGETPAELTGAMA